MIVVLDCNILVMSLTSRSPYHLIYQRLIEGGFDIAITNEILLEYEEIIQLKYGNSTASTFLSLVNELPNVHHTIVYYKWLLMETDPDDNKYVDCAIASKANFIVSEDRHFNALDQISFPEVKNISIDVFLETLKTIK